MVDCRANSVGASWPWAKWLVLPSARQFSGITRVSSNESKRHELSSSSRGRPPIPGRRSSAGGSGWAGRTNGCAKRRRGPRPRPGPTLGTAVSPLPSVTPNGPNVHPTPGRAGAKPTPGPDVVSLHDHLRRLHSPAVVCRGCCSANCGGDCKFGDEYGGQLMTVNRAVRYGPPPGTHRRTETPCSTTRCRSPEARRVAESGPGQLPRPGTGRRTTSVTRRGRSPTPCCRCGW